VFTHDVSSTHVVAFRDIGQDLATGKHRLASQCLGSAPQDWPNPAVEPVEKLADLVSSQKVEWGGVDGTYPRNSKRAIRMIYVVHFIWMYPYKYLIKGADVVFYKFYHLYFLRK